MSKGNLMKQLFFILSLILVSGFSAFAQTEVDSIPITDPDIHLKMSWENERAQLGLFADNLFKNDDSVGFVLMKIDHKTSEDQIKERLEKIIKFLMEDRKISKDRIRLVLQDFEQEETMYWIVPKSEVSECENCLVISTDVKFKETAKFFNQDN